MANGQWFTSTTNRPSLDYFPLVAYLHLSNSAIAPISFHENFFEQLLNNCNFSLILLLTYFFTLCRLQKNDQRPFY